MYFNLLPLKKSPQSHLKKMYLIDIATVEAFVLLTLFFPREHAYILNRHSLCVTMSVLKVFR